MVALERLACIDMEAQLMKDQFEKNDIIGMHKSTGKITRLASKQKSHKITRVFNDAGVLSQSYEEERYAFREYFCKLMQGTESSFEEVVVKDRITSADKYSGLDFSSCWKPIPSPTDVVNMKLLANANKAIGENCRVGRTDKFFPLTMLKVSYPLVVKTYVRLQPAIQWKGGMIHEIFKNKGLHSNRSGYRDVLLADDEGKQICKHIRRIFVPRARQLVFSTQYGGGSVEVRLLLPTFI